MASQKQKKQASPKKEQKNNTVLSGEINREYLGKTLLDTGFEVWFRYMFRVLEGKPFIMDRIHKDMFNVFDDLYNLRITRECMNIPPRAGKTTLCKYWLIYCLTKNPRCNFIYTSFSQMLLSDIAREVAQILEHPIYKELYGSGLFGVEEKEENPIDDFWREYLLKETGKAVYASKRIITAKGGQILFASIGSTITGFGCFDYNTEVLTEKGFMKLGYIVENKIDVKVWSYNFDKRQKELQPIYDYVKNENSPYIKVELDNGEKINCTPDHVFYLKNGEERRADFLSVGSEIMSNKFGNRKIVNIVNCNHSAPSYCVTLCRNNNLFVTKSQILVHNCGIRGAKGFSGALICFPYDELVLTEKGYRKIGEIVENKEDIKVWSYNFEKERPELKRIERHIKNITPTKQCFVEVKLSNGKSFICTDNHKVWTKNRGYVEAKDLTSIDCVVTFSNPFYLVNTKVKNFCNFLSGNVLISDFFQSIRRKFNLFSGRIVNFFNKIFETFSCFDCLNSSGMTIKSKSNLFQTSFCFSNFFNIFSRKFGTRKNQSTKFNSILHIFRFSAISQIFKTIVRWIAIKVSNFYSFLLHANESPQNKLMNTNGKGFIIFSKINNLVTFSIRGIKSFFFELNNSSFISASRKYISRAAYNISKIGNSIKSIISGDVFVNNISVVCHNHTSYCLTVYENHNLYVGKCQVLVSNCDDANKPADIQSEVMREKVRKYYDETLLSRLNDSNVPIFNIQQRLHLEDLSGYLLEQYKFDSIIRPLLEPDGTCNIASQYTPERIKEISFNDTMFQAQYQQSPVAEKGNIIQRDWWVMYDADHTAIDGKLIITADTAYKKTKTADYSCFQVWELLRKEMRLRDMIVGKWEFPELLEKAIQIWRKWTDDSLINPAAFMYIEDKASGISLEQTLIQSGINAICWKPKEYDYPEDKVGRTRELSWDVYRGLVKLKKDDKMSQYLVNEAALFAEDMSHAHDDSCFVAGTKVATILGNKNIEELKVGDLVITPWGVSPITRTTSRMKPVIDNIGLTGTKDHKIYTTHDYSFDNLENVDYSMVSKLTIKELISWQIKSLYCSMAKNTIVTQRQDIMKIKSLLTEKEKHSGFIGLFMNFIREKKFLKAITFITKTKIKIITTLAIWCFYHTANTLNFMAKKPLKFGKDLKCKKQIKEVEKCAKSGIAQKREEIGTQNIKKNTLPNFILLKYVPIAEEDLIPQTTTESRQYVDGVEISTLKENYAGKQKKRVYNITVRAGCYYANNILVSNCDAASMAHSIWRYAGGGQ
jgi:predicted phage terminase large subunit-like protein